MLNIMKGIQPDRSVGDQPNSDISLTPMNLSTMLSSHSKRRERSLSPTAHQRDLDDDIVDSTDSHRSSGPAGPGEQRQQLSGNNGRHSPASPDNIKSRYLDDLRRRASSSGSNIPKAEPATETASSTTHSPPTSAPATPTDDNNLPPRKRKVSQEHAVDRSAQHSDQPNNSSPYNGIRETQQQSQQDSDKDEPIDCR